MKASLLGGVGAMLVVLSGVAFAQEAAGRLEREVDRAVSATSQLTIFDDVTAEVVDGFVLLAGNVTVPEKRLEAERRALGVAGVRGVRNDIKVLPVSASDDALRHRLARAIYGNPAFWSYAAMAQPPIHIVVEHGRVTLRGTVRSNTDRMLAQSLAAGVGDVSVANELRTEANTSVRRHP